MCVLCQFRTLYVFLLDFLIQTGPALFFFGFGVVKFLKLTLFTFLGLKFGPSLKFGSDVLHYWARTGCFVHVKIGETLQRVGWCKASIVRGAVFRAARD